LHWLADKAAAWAETAEKALAGNIYRHSIMLEIYNTNKAVRRAGIWGRNNFFGLKYGFPGFFARPFPAPDSLSASRLRRQMSILQHEIMAICHFSPNSCYNNLAEVSPNFDFAQRTAKTLTEFCQVAKRQGGQGQCVPQCTLCDT
jgi:hypothetical protein